MKFKYKIKTRYMQKPKSSLPKVTGSFLSFFIFCLLFSFSSQAQSGFGIGLQAGSPSGITAKIYNPNDISLEFLVAWDSRRDMYFINVHGLYEQPIGRGPTNLFYGPGGFIGGERQRNTVEEGDVFVAGISGSIGINIFFGDIEVYAQATPRFSIIGITNLSLGGGIGARYYFN